MFNVTNLLEQANEHKMEFLHNRILREAGKTQEQYVSKLIVESLLDNEISELITLREAVENVSGKLSPLVEKALAVNTMGMRFPIKEHSDCNKKIDDCLNYTDCIDKDNIDKSCDIKQLLSPCTTEEPKEVILGSVTDDMVKEAAKEISTSSAFINDIIDKAIKLKSNCYGSVLDINNKIETINMNDNYTEEDVLNTEAAKMNILECCLKSAIGVDLTAKKIKSTFVENAKLIISVANYNPRSFKESNENIMDNLNNLEWVIESSLSSSVDTRTLEEIEEGNTLDSMKASLTLSNKKFLDKYGEAAKKSNCLGIVMKDWYEPKDIDKQFKSLSDEVNKRFGKTYKNLDDLEKDYKRLRGNILGLGGEYENISKKQLGGKSVALVKDLAFEKKEDHVVKKTDVTDAINCLKTVSRQIDDVNSKSTDTALSVAYGNSKGNTIGRTKEERLEAKIDAMKRDLMKILQTNYYKTKLKQLKVLQKQSRLVIMKAARQKPTNEETNIMNKFDSCIDEIGNIIIK